MCGGVRKLGEVFVFVPLAALARARPTYNPRISAIDTTHIGGRLQSQQQQSPVLPLNPPPPPTKSVNQA